MRVVAGLLCVAITACSLGMKPLPPNYDERAIPRCETEPLYAFGDAVAAVALTGGAVAVAVAGHDTESGTSKWVGVVGLGLAALAFHGIVYRRPMGQAMQCGQEAVAPTTDRTGHACSTVEARADA